MKNILNDFEKAGIPKDDAMELNDINKKMIRAGFGDCFLSLFRFYHYAKETPLKKLARIAGGKGGSYGK